MAQRKDFCCLPTSGRIPRTSSTWTRDDRNCHAAAIQEIKMLRIFNAAPTAGLQVGAGVGVDSLSRSPPGLFVLLGPFAAATGHGSRHGLANGRISLSVAASTPPPHLSTPVPKTAHTLARTRQNTINTDLHKETERRPKCYSPSLARWQQNKLNDFHMPSK